jgi:hypothetical protein
MLGRRACPRTFSREEDLVKKPKAEASKDRCHVCGDEFIKDPKSETFRHKRNADCPFQPGEDLDPAVCCRVLAAFGYPDKDCERALAVGGSNPLADPDASNLQKLTDLILDTPYGMSMDWRGDPTDPEYGFLACLARIAATFGVQIEAEFDEEDVDAVMLKERIGKRTRRVRGRTGPAGVALSSLYELAKRVEGASGGRLITRVVRIYEPSDTWGYVTLSPERWRAVEEAAGEAFTKIFMPPTYTVQPKLR